MKRKSLLELDQETTDAAPAWTVSYGDMMSLLLTLFVMLVSMSEIKQNDKFQGVADSLHEQFRFDRSAQSGIAGDVQTRSAPLAVLAVSGRQVRERVMRLKPSGRTVVSDKRSTLTVEIPFVRMTSELALDAASRLETISQAIADKPQLVEVRGLTASRDDLDLAWQRARAVAQRLIDQGNVDPQRLRITVEQGAIDISGPEDASEKSMVEVVLLDENPDRVAARQRNP